LCAAASPQRLKDDEKSQGQIAKVKTLAANHFSKSARSGAPGTQVNPIVADGRLVVCDG
jgi:hypothetical protein